MTFKHNIFTLSSGRRMKPNLTLLGAITLLSVLISAAIAGVDANSIIWSGYYFWPTNSSSDPLYEAYAEWTVPTVYQPPQGCPWFGACAAAVWVGLTNGQGGSTGIAQGGTTGRIDCGFGCGSPTYSAWYQFNPDGAMTCSNVRAQPGDHMTVDVVSAGKWGGNPSTYQIAVTDTTTGASCGGTKTMSMGTPHFGNFIMERPSNARLAKFDTTGNLDVWFHNAKVYYYTAFHSILDPYNSGTWLRYTMVNNGYQNTINGAVQADTSYGKFYILWIQSNGT